MKDNGGGHVAKAISSLDDEIEGWTSRYAGITPSSPHCYRNRPYVQLSRGMNTPRGIISASRLSSDECRDLIDMDKLILRKISTQFQWKHIIPNSSSASRGSHKSYNCVLNLDGYYCWELKQTTVHSGEMREIKALDSTNSSAKLKRSLP